MTIDFHTHIFPPEVRRERERYRQRDAWFGQLYASPRAAIATAEDLVAAMDGCGVEQSVVVNFGWSDPGLCGETNDYLLEAARRFPGRLVPFCSVQPRQGDLAAAEVERCARLGARGVGELMPDGQGFAIDDPALMSPVAGVAETLGLPMMTHASEPVGHCYAGKGRTTPDVLYRFATSFPNLRLVFSHFGGGLPLYGVFRGVREHLSNVYYDTAASPFLYRAEIFRYVAEIMGPERILFATDWPLMGAERVTRQMRSACLAPEAEALILGGNARSLLGG